MTFGVNAAKIVKNFHRVLERVTKNEIERNTMSSDKMISITKNAPYPFIQPASVVLIPTAVYKLGPRCHIYVHSGQTS